MRFMLGIMLPRQVVLLLLPAYFTVGKHYKLIIQLTWKGLLRWSSQGFVKNVLSHRPMFSNGYYSGMEIKLLWRSKMKKKADCSDWDRTGGPGAWMWPCQYPLSWRWSLEPLGLLSAGFYEPLTGPFDFFIVVQTAAAAATYWQFAVWWLFSLNR